MDAIKELKEYDGYILEEQYKIRHRVIQEIKRLRLANSDLQMHYDYAKNECDKLQEERERLIKECERYIEEVMALRKNYGIFPKKEKE